MIYITAKDTREAIENHLSSYFGENSLATPESHEQVCGALDDLNAQDGTLPKDWLISFDHWGNVSDWIDGEVMISYHSKILDKAIVIHPMFETSYPNVHLLAEELIIANDEALRTEQELSILKNA